MCIESREVHASNAQVLEKRRGESMSQRRYGIRGDGGLDLLHLVFSGLASITTAAYLSITPKQQAEILS